MGWKNNRIKICNKSFLSIDFIIFLWYDSIELKGGKAAFIMLIVITAGGVKEKIDNVRSITNSSSGKLGLNIAYSFLESVPNCELIYIYGGTAEPCLDEKGRVENIKIRDTQDLLDIVSHILISHKVDIFIHSMAVADYTTECVIDMEKLKFLVLDQTISDFDALIKDCMVDKDSKISSSMKMPAIILKNTPKVIEQIKKLSPHTFLVGFKLLDNVSEEELFDVGFNLLRKNRCNLVLANDIHHIRQGNHKAMLIYPEKTFDRVEGKHNIAKFIVKKTIERFNVKHPKSIQKSNDNEISDELFSKFYKMGKWLDQSDFLPRVINHDRLDKVGTYGNMSVNAEGCFYITCRNVNKSDLKKSDLSKITAVDIICDDKDIYSNVFYNSDVKPSIDTTIHAEIYRYSNYSHIVHIHTNKVFLGYPLVSEMYPCGCYKECLSITDLIANDPSTHIIQMRKHGLIVLGNSFEACQEKITNLFENTPYIDYDDTNISKECLEHVKETMPSFIVDDEHFFTLKLNDEHIGCIFEDIKENVVHFGLYTMKNVRGKGLHIVEKYLNMYNKSYILHTTDKCEIADFYQSKYGFKAFNILDKRDLQYIKLLF